VIASGVMMIVTVMTEIVETKVQTLPLMAWIYSNWYYDTGATEHLTGQLNKLSTHDHYQGEDRVGTADGTCMRISHIGSSILRTPHNSFQLYDVLHVPSVSKNLLSVHKFTLDNHVFIEFHPFFFLIKDQATRRILF
jgi:histone deacetylase 1/2